MPAKQSSLEGWTEKRYVVPGKNARGQMDPDWDFIIEKLPGGGYLKTRVNIAGLRGATVADEDLLWDEIIRHRTFIAELKQAIDEEIEAREAVERENAKLRERLEVKRK